MDRSHPNPVSPGDASQFQTPIEAGDVGSIMAALSCSATEAGVLMEARAAAQRSYSPYSNFRVGCAIADTSGDVTRGTNVENASYGLSICAERNALFARITQDAPRPTIVAVACIDGDPSDAASLMPCGACRQVLVELCDPEAVVLIDHVGRFTLDDLLPVAFRLPK